MSFEVKSIDSEDIIIIDGGTCIVGHGLIFDKNMQTGVFRGKFDWDNNLLPEEIGGYVRCINSVGGYVIKRPVRRVLSTSKRIIPLNLRYFNNYFHFLIEGVGELLEIYENGLMDDETCIVTGPLHGNMHEALNVVLQALGLRSNVIALDDCDMIHGKAVISVKPIFEFFERRDQNYALMGLRADLGAIDRTRRFFSNIDLACNGSLRIACGRRSSQRIWVNEKECLEIARRNGYLVAECGQLSFVEQIKLFRSASHVIGPTGAWLTNLIFCKKGAEVDVLYPETCRRNENIWDSLFGNFVKIKNNYSEVTKVNNYQAIHSDFRVANFEGYLR